MPRAEINTADTKPAQRPQVPLTAADREPEIIIAAENVLDKEYLDELAFYEEPVTIFITPSAEQNAATAIHVACNGRWAEFLRDGRWIEAPKGYLPVGMELTVKRSTVAILAGSRIDRFRTQVLGEGSERPHNTEIRETTMGCAFSVRRDDNPRGGAWLTALLRRN